MKALEPLQQVVKKGYGCPIPGDVQARLGGAMGNLIQMLD